MPYDFSLTVTALIAAATNCNHILHVLTTLIKTVIILTGTVRSDGSSRFGENHQYANFPAVAFKWRISSESWAPKGVFDDLSLD
jgi:hypothetical protein